MVVRWVASGSEVVATVVVRWVASGSEVGCKW